MSNPQKLDPKQVQDILTDLRKQVSRVDGEITTMKSDAMSGVFNTFAQILNQIYGEKANVETELAGVKKTLEDIYQGHPDIKISMEKKDDKPKPKK